MNKLILSALLFTSATFNSVQAAQPTESIQANQKVNQTQVDFDKVNQILVGLGKTLIRDDEIFTWLMASFDSEETSLDDYKASLEVSATVRSTAWFKGDSAFHTVARIEKTGESVKDGVPQATINPVIAAHFTTPVIDLLQYVLNVYGCVPDESEVYPTPSMALEEALCAFASERVPALQNSHDITNLVVDGLELSKLTLRNYVAATIEKLGETTDQNDRQMLGSYIDSGTRYLGELNHVRLIDPDEGGVGLAFDFEEVFFDTVVKGTFSLDLSDMMIAPAFNTIFDVNKQDFEDLFESVKSVLIDLQNEDKDTLEEAKNFLSGYLEMVKDIISQ